MRADAAFRRLADANPVPEPGSLRTERVPAAVFLVTTQQRSSTMQTSERTLTATPEPPRERPSWLKPVLVGAAAVLAAILIVVFVVGSGEQTPDVATTLPTQTSLPEAPESSVLERIEQWQAAINAGDLEEVLALLSPDSNCDVGAPGTVVETCEQFWGANLGLGAQVDLSCAGAEPPFACILAMNSEAHAALGYPDHNVRSSFPIDIDADGRLITGEVDATAPNFSGGGNETDFRWWAFMREMYPEMPISATFGPNPYDAESGAAMLAAAREMNDPHRLASALTTAFESGDFSDVGPMLSLGRCNTDRGSGLCQDVVPFLTLIDASLALQCDGVEPGDGTITCPATMSSRVHDALGSGPTTFDATIEYRGGAVQLLLLDLAFAADPVTDDAFFAYALDQPDLVRRSDATQPRYSAATADIWIQAAQDFSSGG